MKRALGFMLLPLLCTPALADGVGNFCLTGSCVINNPVYVNVYWDPQWDADVLSAGRPDLTRAKIDALTTSLVNSAYFSQLVQYKVYSAQMAPSLTPSSCGPPPPSMDAVVANNNSLLEAFVDCVVASNPSLNNLFSSGNAILNLYIPPTTLPGNWSPAADHQMISAIAVDVLPTNQAGFNNDVSRVLELTSHEMVEAATDPAQSSTDLSGYKNRDIGSTFGEEIADLCPSTSVFPFLGVGPSFAGATVQNGVTNGKSTGVTQYWSDNANNCVIPFSMTPPPITNVKVCGWGKYTHITLSGTFGPRPWDLASNQYSGQTLFVRASIVHGNNTWSAGNTVLGDDAVGFNSVSWIPGNPDTVTINNFGSNYGSNGWVVGFGDVINVTIFSPINGQSSTVPVNTPLPAAIIFDNRKLHPVASSIVHILGQVTDASGCIIGGVPVELTASAGTLSTQPAILTDDSGEFTSTFTSPDVAGPVTLTANSLFVSTGTKPATLAFNVYPSLISLNATSGPVAGGQKVTIDGVGFDPKATIIKATYYLTTGKSKTSPQPPGNTGQPVVVSDGYPIVDLIQNPAINANHKSVIVTMPPSPFGGDGSGTVSITATVNGIESNALQYQYGIGPGPGILPYIPGDLFDFMSGAACIGCSQASNSGFWMPADSANSNYVTISGRPADVLQRSYLIRSFDSNNFSQLFGETASPVAPRKPSVKGHFVGRPIQISLTSKPGVVIPITDPAMVAFSIPPNSGDNFQIAHVEHVGSELSWVTVKGGSTAVGGTSIRAPITQTGLYAVVSTPKP